MLKGAVFAGDAGTAEPGPKRLCSLTMLTEPGATKLQRGLSDLECWTLTFVQALFKCRTVSRGEASQSSEWTTVCIGNKRDG